MERVSGSIESEGEGWRGAGGERERGREGLLGKRGQALFSFAPDAGGRANRHGGLISSIIVGLGLARVCAPPHERVDRGPPSDEDRPHGAHGAQGQQNAASRRARAHTERQLSHECDVSCDWSLSSRG